MRILAIETSCDDTGIAIIEASKKGDFSVLSNVVASQIELGKKYGGVYPMMAKREHEKNLQPTLETTLNEAKISFENIDLIAITNGPGLEPCLWAGINFAKDLSKKYNIPLIPVNHIEGHILVNILENKKIKFPAIALIVSGGHTQIILVKKMPACRQAGASYEILGETRDDAAGECLDKCAKILGLGYPGGPIIAELAKKGKPEKITLPRPMMHTKDYDFSFSGLKTAVLYKDRDTKIKNKNYKQDMAAEIQQAIIDVLLKKTIKALKDYKAKTLILGGGVSANTELRKQFTEAIQRLTLGKSEREPLNLIFPPAHLSTDNGLMIAIAGYYTLLRQGYGGQAKKTASEKNISANGNLRID